MTHSLSSTVRSFCLLALLTASQAILANDYPTLERVDHVLTCMRLAGGQSVDNLYACSCEIDVIAQQVDFDDFTEARTYEIYKRMPGEKGGLFRESELKQFRLRFSVGSPSRRYFAANSRKQAEAKVRLNEAMCLSLLFLTL